MTLIRQIYSQRQLFELMVDFWHDHFSVFGWDYDGGPMFVAMDRDAIRPNVFGNFRTMLQAVGESASMMYMLDLYASAAGHPNENYARELMELHTLGAENYAGIVRRSGQHPEHGAARPFHRVGRRRGTPQVRRRRRLRGRARADRLDDLRQHLAIHGDRQRAARHVRLRRHQPRSGAQAHPCALLRSVPGPGRRHAAVRHARAASGHGAFRCRQDVPALRRRRPVARTRAERRRQPARELAGAGSDRAGDADHPAVERFQERLGHEDEAPGDGGGRRAAYAHCRLHAEAGQLEHVDLDARNSSPACSPPAIDSSIGPRRTVIPTSCRRGRAPARWA